MLQKTELHLTNLVPCTVCYILHTEFHGFNSRIDVSGLSHFGSWYQLNFLETVWVPSSAVTLSFLDSNNIYIEMSLKVRKITQA